MQFHLSLDFYEQDSELSLSVRLRELNDKGKVQLGNPKSGRSRLREWSLELVRSFNFCSSLESMKREPGTHFPNSVC